MTRTQSISVALASAILCACSSGDSGPATIASPKFGHVFIVMLENESYVFENNATAAQQAPYLVNTLPSIGVLLKQYYGTGHVSNDNYLSMISGQGPNADTQGDCLIFSEFRTNDTQPGTDGQTTGQGCVYPSFIKTIGAQLDSAGLGWRGYMEDMGLDPARDNAFKPTDTGCGHPVPDTQDKAQSAQAQSATTVKDYYATRHNPFVYFHSITDNQIYCDQHVVPLTALPADLGSLTATPHYVFITPNLCNDGHDTNCSNGDPGGLPSVDTFLKKWVPQIMASPAYKQDGLLIVTFDEAANSDATDCSSAPTGKTWCSEPPGFNTAQPGITGPGGGRIGAVLISPSLKPGTSSAKGYNHYSMLRSIEDIFGLPHLGLAGSTTTPAFGPDVYNATQ